MFSNHEIPKTILSINKHIIEIPEITIHLTNKQEKSREPFYVDIYILGIVNPIINEHNKSYIFGEKWSPKLV